MKEIRGEQFGVRFVKHPKMDKAIIQIITEDDENWFEHGNPFSQHWIDELIEVLQKAKDQSK